MFEKIRNFVNWDYLLFYRFVGINAIGIVLLFLSYLNGWAAMVVAADVSNIVWIIFGTFILGTVLSGIKIFHISLETNKVHNGQLGKYEDYIQNLRNNEHLAEALKLKIVGKIVFIRLLASTLVTLGLIGTVVGFIILLGGLPEVSNADQAFSVVTSIGRGMGVALYTTLVGSIFNIWARINYQILATGATNLVSEVLKAKV